VTDDLSPAHLGALFEGTPRFLVRLAGLAPGAGPTAARDPLDFFARARRIAHTMPEDEQVELVDAHPRLGAPPGTLSASSYLEQGCDGGTATGPRSRDVAAELERLNAAYEARFGFRYCVFVAGRSRAALLPGMLAALEADRAAELDRALDAVIDIAIDRHAKLSAEANP